MGSIKFSAASQFMLFSRVMRFTAPLAGQGTLHQIVLYRDVEIDSVSHSRSDSKTDCILISLYLAAVMVCVYGFHRLYGISVIIKVPPMVE